MEPTGVALEAAGFYGFVGRVVWWILRLFGITNEPNVIVYEPYNNAKPEEPIVVWHVRAANVRRTRWKNRWIIPRPAKECIVDLVFRQLDGRIVLATQGRWESDVGPTEKMDLVYGDREKDLPVICRATKDALFRTTTARDWVSPIEKEVAHVMGVRFCVHSDASERLSPGQYWVAVIVKSNGKTLTTGNFLLSIPEGGLDGFILQDPTTIGE